MTRKLFKTFVAASAMSLWASTAMADTFALVVGINEYEAVSDLKGAVNDARWIASSLSEFGIRDLTVLLNEEATYDRIKDTYFAYLQQADPGDTLIFTYAGHGRYVDDKSGDEATAADPYDVQDETLVLSGFSQRQPGEEIIDDGLSFWFQQAELAGVNVVFLADSCHSGTVSRGGRARLVDEYAVAFEPLSRPLGSGTVIPEEDLSNLVFLSGAPEADVVTEVFIEGRYHGALSYAFGNALRDLRGDLDQDGMISRNELKEYIPRAAQAYNDGRILPDIIAPTGEDFAVLKPGEKIANFADPLSSASQSAGTSGAKDPYPDLDLVPLKSRPDLIWDRRTGHIADQDGERVATAVARNRLADVDAKFRLLQVSREALLRKGFDITLTGQNDQRVERLSLGDGFTVEVGPLPYPYLTIFNLANNGEVQVIYPFEPSERKPVPLNTRVRFDAEAAPPAGIDHIVAIASRTEPKTLRQQLGWNMTTSAFIPTLEQLTVLDDLAVAIVSSSTVER